MWWKRVRFFLRNPVTAGQTFDIGGPAILRGDHGLFSERSEGRCGSIYDTERSRLRGTVIDYLNTQVTFETGESLSKHTVQE